MYVNADIQILVEVQQQPLPRSNERELEYIQQQTRGFES